MWWNIIHCPEAGTVHECSQGQVVSLTFICWGKITIPLSYGFYFNFPLPAVIVGGSLNIIHIKWLAINALAEVLSSLSTEVVEAFYHPRNLKCKRLWLSFPFVTTAEHFLPFPYLPHSAASGTEGKDVFINISKIKELSHSNCINLDELLCIQIFSNTSESGSTIHFLAEANQCFVD